MKRNDNHLIGEEAQRIFEGSVPQWLVNEQKRDYGKDYLVEITDDSYVLTSQHFLVQLKGQKKLSPSVDRQAARFQLESKYAERYDQTHDLPVFLVLVDAAKKAGWYVFLQPILETNRKWRSQKSMAVYVPFANSISDIPAFRQAVENAKEWLRVNHSASIQDSYTAHRRRIIAIDSRFDLELSTKDGVVAKMLVPKEEVALSLTVSAKGKDSKKAFRDFGKGLMASAEGLQISIEGSPLFESTQFAAIQVSVNKKGDCSLICRDSSGNELGAISGVPGTFSGGLLEQQFQGTLPQSPLNLTVGPIVVGTGGKVNVRLKFLDWEGQRLRYLTQFNMLHDFFMALPESAATVIECRIDSQVVFSTSVQLQTLDFVRPLAYLLKIIWRARRLAEHFKINPQWQLDKFDEEGCETIEQLYAIVFENGWKRRTPDMDLTFACGFEKFTGESLEKTTKPGDFVLTSMERWEFLGELIDIGWIERKYEQVLVTAEVIEDSQSERVNGQTVEFHVTGGDGAITSLRLGSADADGKISYDGPGMEPLLKTPSWTLKKP